MSYGNGVNGLYHAVFMVALILLVFFPFFLTWLQKGDDWKKAR